MSINESCEVSNLGTLKGIELGITCASKLNEAKLNLDYSTIYYWNNFPCGGKLELSGTCTFLKIWNFALMQVDAKNLITNHVLVENSGKLGNSQAKDTFSISSFVWYSLYETPFQARPACPTASCLFQIGYGIPGDGMETHCRWQGPGQQPSHP